MSKLKVYAWTKPGCPNFGDEMGPDILSRLGHQVERVPIHEAEVITIGSVMHHAVGARRGVVIAGAGVMHSPTSQRQLIDNSYMDIRLLRGPLTRAALTDPNRARAIPFGDPAMLAADLYPTAKRPIKQYSLGWVPHYIDSRKHYDVLADVTIDVLQEPKLVIDQIAQCRYILTSSLHALIVAQAFAIPAQRLPHPRVNGGDTKWLDYAAGYARANRGEIYRVLEGL